MPARNTSLGGSGLDGGQNPSEIVRLLALVDSQERRLTAQELAVEHGRNERQSIQIELSRLGESLRELRELAELLRENDGRPSLQGRVHVLERTTGGARRHRRVLTASVAKAGDDVAQLAEEVSAQLRKFEQQLTASRDAVALATDVKLASRGKLFTGLVAAILTTIGVITAVGAAIAQVLFRK